MFDSDEYSDNELPISSILSVPYSTYTNISHDEQSKTENLTKDYECDICGQIFSKHSLIINHFITSLCYPSCSFYPENDDSLYSLYKYSDNFKYYNNNIKETSKNRICFPEDEFTKRNGKLSRSKKNYFYFNCNTINDINTLKSHRLIHTKLSVPNSITSTTQDLFQSYECSKCSKVFHSRSDITNHIFSDHVEDYLKHSCDTCSRIHFNDFIFHQEKKRFKCDMSKYICHKSFSTLYRLNQHIKWHIGLNKFECQFCSKIFTKYSTYLFHERTHSKETPFRCHFCDKWFPASCNINFHSTTKGNSFENYFSQAMFDKTLLSLIIHTEKKQLKDTNYNNLTVKSTSLEVQRSQHTSKELYHCKVCGKSFLRLSLLHSHLKIHLDKTIQQNNGTNQNVSKLISSQVQRVFFTDKHFFQCDICQKIFSDRHGYINHRCALFKCKFCRKLLSNNFSLKRHYLNVHKISKPFECNLCRKSFQETISLNRHKQCHTLFREKELLEETKIVQNNGYKKYKCDLCQTFHNQYQICSHILETHQ